MIRTVVIFIVTHWPMLLRQPGNSGTAATLPNSTVSHAVHLGMIAGSLGVAAAPHVKITKRHDQYTQAIVRLEGVTQQRHRVLCDFWLRPQIERSQLEVEG